ncbi:hypothetical protein [Desulfosporosinus sp. FKA]|uniref:DUF6906 family protein n=1 Tax=Desulfosporosinus sp. FKA TaxID=1969834 RepID=UPI0015544492|nr:hypothetical protein [Desulfosporosinus sp. FKA]
MKHGRKPNAKQKARITLFGLNHEDWFVTKNTPSFFQIIHRDTGEVRSWKRREAG